MSMIIRWRIKSRDCSIEQLMVCWQNDIAQICQNGLLRCCLVEEHAPQRSVPHNAAFWGVFYNRSSAVDVRALMPRGRQANPVLTCETALRRFFCDTSRRVGQSDDVGNRRWLGSGVPPARRGWCRGESRHATLRFAYRVTEECRRSATRECKPGDVVSTTALRR